MSFESRHGPSAGSLTVTVADGFVYLAIKLACKQFKETARWNRIQMHRRGKKSAHFNHFLHSRMLMLLSSLLFLERGLDGVAQMTASIQPPPAIGQTTHHQLQ